MTPPLRHLSAISLFVENLQAAKAFYQQVFGVEVIFEDESSVAVGFDAVCAQLRERGVALLTGPRDRPWGMRTATFVDPAGHSWEIGQRIVSEPTR